MREDTAAGAVWPVAATSAAGYLSCPMRDQLAAALSDRYTLERELGRGGMASVWLARDLRLDRPVAIKVLHPELAGAIGVERFVREVRVTARLQHPGVVPVLDSGSFAGPGGIELPWYAMAYVPGESLRQRLDRERQLPVEDALRITGEVADALAAAHREGIVHRDIKPENILLAGGRAWVADFGIARALVETGGERLTSTGIAIGTPAYMSPEQATADLVDARTDQYSLATVLYEMLAGEPPFAGPTAHAIMARRVAGPPRPIHPVRPAAVAYTHLTLPTNSRV
jgi:serine/threonine protein kinase